MKMSLTLLCKFYGVLNTAGPMVRHTSWIHVSSSTALTALHIVPVSLSPHAHGKWPRARLWAGNRPCVRAEGSPLSGCYSYVS
jgi:hypothetical protein